MTTPLFPVPRKAVIAVGFNGPLGQGKIPGPLPYGALAERLSAADRLSVLQAVEEALAVGLDELIFVTQEGPALVDHVEGGVSNNRSRQIIVPKLPVVQGLGQALCRARELIGAEPFVVLPPGEFSATATGAVARLLAAYRHKGGNLATVIDGETLRREGTFSAIRTSAAGHYLLQPDVFDVLEANPEFDLPTALLTMAEAWPVTAVLFRDSESEPGIGRRPQLHKPKDVAEAAN